MRKRLFRYLIIACLSLQALSQNTKVSGSDADLAVAADSYRKGDFATAAQKYSAILKAEPGLVSAEVGLVRSLLGVEKVDEAFAAASNALAAQPNSAALLAAMADVEFRRAEMSEAELNYIRAIKLDRNEVAAYVGLARLDAAFCLYGRAYRALRAAHQLAPTDPAVQRLWLTTLPRRERMAAIEAYLAGDHPDSAEETQGLQEDLQYLRATITKPVHACKLVNKVESTEINLQTPSSGTKDSDNVSVKVNDRNARLLVDSGASGIVLYGKAGTKSGLEKISDVRVLGIGDKGLRSGYTAAASRIRVGDLEFEDCVVVVLEKTGFPDEDGLIGTDVFSDYLIDLDMRSRKLRLSPLPKRPDEEATPAALTSYGEDDSADEPTSAPGSGQAANAKPAPRIPADRYVAPEMTNWLPIFLFGHHLLIPTRVNDSKPMLFLIDTGAFDNMLSTATARREGYMRPDLYNTGIQGLSGSVDKVYRTHAKLQFGGLAQDNQNVVTFDLSTISRGLGTEVSGLLGFDMLSLLDLKIDYRDGLVDFTYKPKK